MKKLITAFAFGATLIVLSASVFANGPDCTNPEGWPSSMAFVYLKNAGIIKNMELDFNKTKTTKLASEKIGKELYRQVHLVIFYKKTGGQVFVITVNNASNEECSMSDVDVYVVSKQLTEPNH